jgi:polyhydroxyalkanoate synthesis regulator phasin
MHSIKHENLEAAVLYAIRQQAFLAVSQARLIAEINEAPAQKNQSGRLKTALDAKEKELFKIQAYKTSLYQDWKDGEISRDDYRRMSADYERQAEASQTILENLRAEQAALENGVNAENPAREAFRKSGEIEALTREILAELIDHIKIFEGGDVAVTFKFENELRRIAEFIEINGATLTEKAG